MTIEQPRARYQQVAAFLRDAIERGEYPSETVLPSQPELARRFDLNQTTINRAIGVLRAEGLVRVEHGRGVFVQSLPTAKRMRRIPRGGGQGSTFATEMRRLGLEPHTELVEVGARPAPDEIAEYLHIGEDERALVRKRHMYASGNPVQLATSYIPLSIAGDEGIAYPDTGPTGMYDRLAALSYRPVHFVEEIEMRRPDAEEADFLQLWEGQYVLSVLRTAHSADGTPVEATANVFAGNQWRLTYEWDVDTSNE